VLTGLRAVKAAATATAAFAAAIAALIVEKAAEATLPPPRPSAIAGIAIAINIAAITSATVATIMMRLISPASFIQSGSSNLRER
jgi:hypothetical protein